MCASALARRWPASLRTFAALMPCSMLPVLRRNASPGASFPFKPIQNFQNGFASNTMACGDAGMVVMGAGVRLPPLDRAAPIKALVGPGEGEVENGQFDYCAAHVC